MIGLYDTRYITVHFGASVCHSGPLFILAYMASVIHTKSHNAAWLVGGIAQAFFELGPEEPLGEEICWHLSIWDVLHMHFARPDALLEHTVPANEM